MNIIKTSTCEDMNRKAYEIIINYVQMLPSPVFGLATGATPEYLYTLLSDAYRCCNISFASLTTFNLDEYVGLSKNDSNSYRYYMNEKLFNNSDIPKNQIHIPDGNADHLINECSRYEKMIQQSGGIDLQILGLGHNGHIGFNEPGTSFSARTHVVDLDESTRAANSRFFSEQKAVPVQAITMGIETILESREIILLVSGKNKSEALRELLHGEVSEAFPASILQKHKHVTIIADEAALSSLDHKERQHIEAGTKVF